MISLEDTAKTLVACVKTIRAYQLFRPGQDGDQALENLVTLAQALREQSKNGQTYVVTLSDDEIRKMVDQGHPQEEILVHWNGNIKVIIQRESDSPTTEEAIAFLEKWGATHPAVADENRGWDWKELLRVARLLREMDA